MPPLPLPPGYSLAQRLSKRPEGEVVEALREGARFVLRLGRANTDEARAELELLAGFRHPDVASLDDHGPLPGGGLYLARPFVEGQVLERWAVGKSHADIAKVVARLSSPLIALHRAGFVHGDLKPANVIVRPDGRPLLVDFGLAARRDGAIAGTEFYLAPELLRGGSPSPASDAFSLGVLLHRLVSPTPTTAREFYGRFPARPFLEAIQCDVEALPIWARQLVVGLTARDPHRRPPLARVGRSLAVHFEFSIDSGVDSPANLANLVGRESWFDTRVRVDLEGTTASPNRTWWTVPNADDARALFRALHVRLSLRNRGERGLNLDSLGVTSSPGELLAATEAVAETLLGTTALLTTSSSEWSQRKLELVDGGTRSQAEHRGLLVVAPFAPLGDLWDEFEVPALSHTEVVAHIVERYGTGARGAIDRIARDVDNRADLLARLFDAQERGLLLVTSLGWELVPDATLWTPGTRLPLEPEELRVVTALSLMERPVSFAELPHLLSRSKSEIAAVTARLLECRAISLAENGRLLASGRPTAGLANDEPDLLEGVANALAADGDDELRAKALRLAARANEANREAIEDLVEDVRRDREYGAPERALTILQEFESLVGSQLPMPLLTEEVHAWLDLGRADRAQEALQHVEDPVAPGELGRLELVRARLADRTHQTADALEHLSRAESVDPSLAPRVLAERVFLHGRRGEDQRVLELADEHATGTSLVLDDRSAWTLRSTVAMSRFRTGEVDRARNELSALLSDLTGNPERAAGVHVNLAILERRAGVLPRAIEHLRSAREGFLARGDLVGLALVAATLGSVLRDAGELSEAERELDRAFDLRLRIGDEAGVLAIEALQALVAQERGHVQPALDGLEKIARRSSSDLPPGFRALLGARALELRARIGELPPRDRVPSEDESIDPRSLMALANSERLAGRTKRSIELAIRARNLAHSLRLAPIEVEAQRRIAELENLPGPDMTFASPMLRDDARAIELLEEGANLDAACVESLAEDFESRGRDDRAARMWIALAARADHVRATSASIRAERAFERAALGLGTERAAAFRLALLGMPDPFPTDLQKRPSRDDDSLDEMAIQTLLAIHEQLATESDLGALFQHIVKAAIKLTGAERGFLVLEENGKLHFDLALDSSLGGIARPELETSRTIIEDCLERGQPMRLSNAVDDPLTAEHASVVSLELRSILCVPFVAAPSSRGVLVLDHRLRTGAFDERAESLAELVARMAALATLKVRHGKASIVEADLEKSEPANTGLVGSSPAMRRVAERIARLAPSEIPVLIVGASGTGKELVAHSLFRQSSRASGAFVAENCAALPPSLIESELFGHRRGAFTGADRDHAGLFERAHQGTLFLDEIGELPLELQARLLRVLENGELRRVGDDRVRHVDVRLLTATNRNLELEADEGRFRHDLLYRLDGARIEMPGLEERPEDVPELVRHFLDRIAERTGEQRRITSSVIGALAERTWPGNVRELKNEIERLCVLSSGDVDDPTLVRQSSRRETTSASSEVETLAAVEERAIMRAIESCGGDKREAARRLGISRAKIYQRLKEWSERDEAPR